MNPFASRLAGWIGLAWWLVSSPATAQVHEWRTLAGHPGGGGFRDGIGDAARFLGPRALELDAAGNLLVGDMYNNAIRIVAPSRAVTTLARSVEGFVFGWISDFGSDAAGNVYALDSSYRKILKISPAGDVVEVIPLAGLSGPQGIEVLPDGTCFIADYLNHRIVKIPPGGEAVTFAGLKSAPGNTDGQGEAARFQYPSDIKLGPDGFLYVMDRGNLSIRKMDLAGNVERLPLSSVLNHVGYLEIGPDGTMYLTGYYAQDILTISPTLQLSSLPCVDEGTGQPSDLLRVSRVLLDANGNLFLSEPDRNRIRKRTPAGVVSMYAGSPPIQGSENGFGAAAGFFHPYGLALDAGGALHVADLENHLIRKILTTGEVTTLSGAAGQAGSANGSVFDARFHDPRGSAFDPSGRLLIADAENDSIRRILPNGTVETLAGSPGSGGFANGTGAAARFNGPIGIATDGEGNAYVADHSNNSVRKVTPDGVVTTVWSVSQPTGVAVDGGGNLYVTGYDHSLRKMTPEGVKSVVAGLPGTQGSADGTGSTARFNYPCGLALGPTGDLHVADTGNHLIRKVTPDGAVSTIAGRDIYGTSNYGGNADGRGEVARFNSPTGIAVSSTGEIFVSDQGNHRIVRGVSVGDPEVLFGEWAASSGLAGEDADSEAKPFGDGVENLLKYAFNLNGSAADERILTPGTGTAGLPHVTLADGFSGKVLRVEYLRRIGSGLRYEPLRTTDLENFLSLTGPQTVTPVDASWERVVVQEHPGVTGKSRLLVTVRVTLW